MLSGRLKADWKLQLALAAALACMTAVAFIAVTAYSQMSAALADKSENESRNLEEIVALQGSLQAQKAELDSKNAELTQVQDRLGAVTQELADRDQALEEQAGNSQALEAKVSELADQSALLQTQISALQAKIQLDAQRIEKLSEQSGPPGRTIISHYGLGVDQDDHGVVFPIKVEIVSGGSGALSVDINNVQYQPGFQSAVRSAAIAASRYAGTSTADKDIIVRFAYEGSSGGSLVKVDGSSAGAVISAMIASGLTGKHIDDSILVTGSMGEDGTIGRIGSIEEKVAAAEAFGAKAVLVPETQQFESADMPVIGVANIGELMDRLAP